MTKQQFLDKAHNIHGYKYKYIDLPSKFTLLDYIKINLNNVIYTQRVNKHLLGKCCEKTTPIKTNKQFIKESKNIWKDTFDYSLTNYTGANNKLKLINKLTGIIVEQIPSLHLQGHLVKKIDNKQFIELSKLVSDYKYSYDKCLYINKTKKITLICEKHGEFLIHPFNHLNYGDICTKCNETVVFKLISKYLKNINFTRQYKFNDMNLPFDFYIPSMRIVIDFQDKNHFDPNFEYYNQLKINEKIKNDYCEEHYINLIRIKYTNIDNIESILKESIKNYRKV